MRQGGHAVVRRGWVWPTGQFRRPVRGREAAVSRQTNDGDRSSGATWTIRKSTLRFDGSKQQPEPSPRPQGCGSASQPDRLRSPEGTKRRKSLFRARDARSRKVSFALVNATPRNAATLGLTANAGTETCRRLRFYAKRGKGLRRSCEVVVSRDGRRAPARQRGAAHLARKSQCLWPRRAGGLAQIAARFTAIDRVQESRFSTARLCEGHTEPISSDACSRAG